MTMKTHEQTAYDVIVVGGGHGGCEAALAAARLGAETLLITINMDHIAQMSCNPAIGGIAKGQVVREIDALGGSMGAVTDAATVQFRMLNAKKGPAVWSPRSQCDKVCYQRAMKRELEIQPNLDVKQAMVTGFKIAKGRIVGVTTHFGDVFPAKRVVLATGTFLRGKLHYGLMNEPGGRAGDPASDQLAVVLRDDLKLRVGRLKTGTPPRVLAKTIDFDAMTPQEAEIRDGRFSYFSDHQALPRASRSDMPCFIVSSTAETAAVIRANLEKSPLYQGVIKGTGTRYCPSFEDKVVRFPHHEKHQLYLEPEGEHTEEYYLNGISTSLPPDVQVLMLHSIPGLESARISRYAYAIEYDVVFPDQLERSLMVKTWPNLFLAGQINGTSGYEEAAGQGLIAGMNAARAAAGKEPVELSRDMAYIGVMIDDLVTKEIVEPYRLFTSRAEYRLRLRQDNADNRLCDFAFEHGLLPESKHRKFVAYRDALTAAIETARSEKIKGGTLWNALKSLNGIIAAESDVPFDLVCLNLPADKATRLRILRQLAIQAHYEGYLSREEKSINQLRKLESWRMPDDFDYDAIKGLRNESRMKLNSVRPTTLAQASRIDGVTPSEIALLQVHLKRQTVSTPH